MGLARQGLSAVEHAVGKPPLSFDMRHMTSAARLVCRALDSQKHQPTIKIFHCCESQHLGPFCASSRHRRSGSQAWAKFCVWELRGDARTEGFRQPAILAVCQCAQYCARRHQIPRSTDFSHQRQQTGCSFGSAERDCCQASLPCCGSGCLELFRNIGASAKVHLVGSLAIKGGMRQLGVMLLDVKRDQLLHRRQAIECVQLQPLVFEHAPPSFDHRI